MITSGLPAKQYHIPIGLVVIQAPKDQAITASIWSNIQQAIFSGTREVARRLPDTFANDWHHLMLLRLKQVANTSLLSGLRQHMKVQSRTITSSSKKQTEDFYPPNTVTVLTQL